jgi:hypothetical protein
VDELHDGAPVRNREHRVSAPDNLRKEIRGSGFRGCALGWEEDLSDGEPVCRGCDLAQDEQGQAEAALSEEQGQTK